MNAKKGFTLVEMLVAIGLFSIIVAIAAGGFTNALRTQRQVASLIAAQSNAGLALEQIAREARTGYLFCHGLTGGPTCTPAGGGPRIYRDLNFYNAAGANVCYTLANGALQRNDNCGGGGTPQSVTGANVAVTYLTFTLFGNQENDHWNPRVTIVMGVAPSSTDPAVANNVLSLQTTVSARGIDCSASGC